MRVALQGPLCYLSVCPWPECRGEFWLENVFIDGYIQVTPAKLSAASTSALQPDSENMR